ncbi:putative mRNA transport regulator [Aulographum hederae CBS 113979]|uniref:Putative mRNA transport regulator n=1 Tax=Aulographum hederae CBS 113979 TaxID=1176131 RepID=A0A6G1H2Q1_9PEZI|nr:putative mRNA transport regulator [Aulographum hederae CBS 113979]
MASTADAIAPVLQAVDALQSNADREAKIKAHEYLDNFQKTATWQATVAILQVDLPDHSVSVQQRMFAATTLKGKIIFDISQVPRDARSTLRDTILTLLKQYQANLKPIRTQLCVCLANLAIQMLEWPGPEVLPLVFSTLGDQEGLPCVLEFLHVLPEEVTEGRKINLSEDNLARRTKELIEDNVKLVLQTLSDYAKTSRKRIASAPKNPQLYECITTWSREIPLNDIVNSPLLGHIFGALSNALAFEPAVECICAILRETRDVDESINIINTLAKHIISLQPHIKEAAEENPTQYDGLTRILAEAGEAWVVLIARSPDHFRPLVEAILECAARDQDRDVISFTFLFWSELKQYLLLERYQQAKLTYADIFSKLVDIMIGHLQYPTPEEGEDPNEDLFDGDREQEEKFREFRHQMGDVLKDCCEVMGAGACLFKAYILIEEWVKENGAGSRPGHLPKWQMLEAPLFSMRTMGRMVPPDEEEMLPKLIPLIVQIPPHDKVQFQAVMALGRYTEWTAKHPDTLDAQLQYIMSAFNHTSNDVVRAAALSFKFFCNDCATLLKDHIGQLHSFYSGVLYNLPKGSREDITDGVASVAAQVPVSEIYSTLKMFLHPIAGMIVEKASMATTEDEQLWVADQVQLLTIFFQSVQPYVGSGSENPAVKYCGEVFPVLAGLIDRFGGSSNPTSVPILERVCRCWRYQVLSYRTFMITLLPQLADKLAEGFSTSRQGCFLWATDAIVREFSEGQDYIDSTTTSAIYSFFESQATTFLRALNDLQLEAFADVVEDFFRLGVDALVFYPYRFLPSALMPDILQAATASLGLLKEEPLQSTLHFLRDFLGYGMESSPFSLYSPDQSQSSSVNPPEIRARVHELLRGQGELLTRSIMTGMMYSFPRDCFPDASGVLLALFQVMPREVAQWVGTTVSMLPAGSVSPEEGERLLNSINARVQEEEFRKIRSLLQDFTNSYRRRNVAPREGLGRLEATRFRFSG